jgi:hypothetical protein
MNSGVTFSAKHERDLQRYLDQNRKPKLKEYEECLSEANGKRGNGKGRTCPHPPEMEDEPRKADFHFALIASLIRNRDSLEKLLNGLVLMYMDEKVDKKYYDQSLLQKYSRGNMRVALVIIGLGAMSLLVPVAVRV